MEAPSYIKGVLSLPGMKIPVIETHWNFNDRVGAMKVRWGIGRNSYKVAPKLYAVGSPDRNSRVFVTSNYKLTFDHVKAALHGLDAWLLVLETKGVNVWCAAGKKTFGSKELINRINLTQLDQVVDHRKLILPQLGAVGIAAHEVLLATGFHVIYGPVQAKDIHQFLQSGLKASEEMRRIRFPLWERLKVIPVDIFYGKYYLIMVPALFLLLSGAGKDGYNIDLAVEKGWRAVINLYCGYLAGCVLGPILLPWIPFRRFSLKGMVTGLIVAIVLMFAGNLGNQPLQVISWFLMITGISSFMAMNFTGSSTFTSLSGVQKEMKTALPVQIAAAALGLITFIVTLFLS
ncbi:MAG: mercury methylation corrinoid protein HgcA [Bacteroidota bacterium]